MLQRRWYFPRGAPLLVAEELVAEDLGVEGMRPARYTYGQDGRFHPLEILPEDRSQVGSRSVLGGPGVGRSSYFFSSSPLYIRWPILVKQLFDAKGNDR